MRAYRSIIAPSTNLAPRDSTSLSVISVWVGDGSGQDRVRVSLGWTNPLSTLEFYNEVAQNIDQFRIFMMLEFRDRLGWRLDRGGAVDEFTTSFANGFSASLGGSVGTISVQNDQMNGSATLPADGFIISASNTTSNTLNGFSNPYMQFGVRQENIAGQLWDDTLPPDLADWSLITLAAINGPDWRWMDFGLTTQNFSDDQIRWAVTGFSVSAVPIPAAAWLFGTGILGLIGFSKRRKMI